MSGDTLLALGSLTLGGAAAVIIFALLSRVIRTRYAARWRCWIWLVLCVRLIIPVSFADLFGETESKAPIQVTVPSDVVIFEPQASEMPNPEKDPDPDVTQNAPPMVTPVVTPAVTPNGSEEEVPPSYEEPGFTLGKVTVVRILCLIWYIGMVVSLVWALISHIRFLRYVKRWSKPVKEAALLETYREVGDQLCLKKCPSLHVCPGLKAPMLAGGLHYLLLLPEETPDAGSLRYVLIHELTHYKRRDILLKTIALLAKIVHWFNPFIWYMVHLIERDTELACDEAALRQLPDEEHSAYGRTILRAVENMKVKD